MSDALEYLLKSLQTCFILKTVAPSQGFVVLMKRVIGHRDLVKPDPSCCVPRSPSVPGPPFASQPAISSVTGVKPSISTVTTANQSMMPQQPVAPNQQQPVPPQGQPVPNQPPQAPPQQQPAPNQPNAPSAQPNMVGYVSNSHHVAFCPVYSSLTDPLKAEATRFVKQWKQMNNQKLHTHTRCELQGNVAGTNEL